MRVLRSIPALTISIALGTFACSESSRSSAVDGDDGSDNNGPDTDFTGDAGNVGSAFLDGGGVFILAPDAAVVGPGNDHCKNATVIPVTTSRSLLMADTTSATHDVSASCATDSGPDVFYQFTVSKRVIIYADTFGATWNTVLFLTSSDCTPITASTMNGDTVCSDDSCGTSQSRIVALLSPGNYRLWLGGNGGATGQATIHFEFALAASGIEAPLPQGASMQTGTTVGLGGNVANEVTSCVAAGPEDGYWWTTCPGDSGGSLSASTCGGASWATVLETEIPRSLPYACSQDGCDRQTTLTADVAAGAGLHVLLIDGQSGSDSGPYSMIVSRP